MEYPAEQQAIRQFLSKPTPNGFACGCMGPSYISEPNPNRFEFTLKYQPDNRLICIKVIHDYLNVSMPEAKLKLDNNEIKFQSEYDKNSFARILDNNKVQYEIKENGSNMYPLCPCRMDYVSEVNGNFYKIDEHRSPDGITHTARLLGPVGGPYIK